MQPALFADLADTETPVIYACSCGRARRVVYPAGTSWQPSVTCSCGRYMPGQRITGTRTGHRCDARCMFARGPSCECSCGGKNHGVGFAR